LRCDHYKTFLVELFRFPIAYVDPDIAGMRVGKNNIQLFSCHWPGDNESRMPIVTSIVDTTILLIMNVAIAHLPDRSRKIRQLWGCLEQRNGECSLYAHTVSTIVANNTAAGWVQAAIELSNPMLFCVMYHGQHADGTDGAQTLMRGGLSDLPLDEILPPSAEDMIDIIGDESDDDGETRRPYPRDFLTTTIGFGKFEWTLQKWIIRKQRYIEVIRNMLLVSWPITSKLLLLMRIWLLNSGTITF
jgi:hypothetical protein